MVLQGIFGIIVFVLLAVAISERPKHVSWRVIIIGVAFQLFLAAILLKLPTSEVIFLLINDAVLSIQNATKVGTSFVFGYLGGAPLPFMENFPGGSFILAFQALPLILIVSALSSLLFHWGVLPAVIRGLSWSLKSIFGIGGSVSLATAANIFIGMVESPILIKPYLCRLSRGELFTVMTAGMATIAGTVLILYASLIGKAVPNAISHLLTASLISAPAAVMIAKLMIPDEKKTQGSVTYPKTSSSIDAITQGTTEGVRLLINVIAMLIVAVSLVALTNNILSLAPPVAGETLTLQRILGWLMAPIVWLMGIPWSEAFEAGRLMGIKIILNEFLAFNELAGNTGKNLSEHSRMVMTYGLCGFANFGSAGIMIGGLTAMAPERRAEITALSGKAIVSGTLASCITGSIASLLL